MIFGQDIHIIFYSAALERTMYQDTDRQKNHRNTGNTNQVPQKVTHSFYSFHVPTLFPQ